MTWMNSLLMTPLAALALLVLSAGCSDVEDLDNFDVTINQQTAIPGASALELLLGNFPVLDSFTAFDLAQEASFKNSGRDANDVDKVTLAALTFKTVDPPGQDLAFFGEVIFFIEAEGLPRKEIARQEDFPAGATTVAFDTSPDDLKDYVLVNRATITVEINDTSRPPQETIIEVKAVFNVDVNVL